jgi:hypothetical protein
MPKPKVLAVWIVGILQGIASVTIPSPYGIVNILICILMGAIAADLDFKLHRKN